ncbi:DUF2798 domain-containing protein [Paenibacillus sp. LMG 31460]|uniref:DUF2798 domain-containing protein n=1 Tax=Paenibacillus germinis TaxID=2654979 RepID=A0ABX1ZBJ4_9BACL|nr:DUF2798 domain-containing protein [Paenibacillus germinis]NOU89303.1 DUF2798 domain-containing protein [Paenibacillus germinis]
MRINHKYRQLTFVSIMSMIMTFIMSGIMTYVLEGGFIPYFVSTWMKDWGVAFVIAFGLNLFLPAKIRKFANRFKKAQIVYIFAISLIMTFVLSFALTAFAMNGIVPYFVSYWTGAWRIAFIIVFVLNFFLPQFVGKLVSKLIVQQPALH